MSDVYDTATRTRVMRAVKSKHTKPELQVRRLVHGLGYRYRLHGAHLPGTPDLVFARRRKVICVQGCFWHGHVCARGSRMPKNNGDYWRGKIARNVARDMTNRVALEALGWATLEVWECELADAAALCARVQSFLDDGSAPIISASKAPASQARSSAIRLRKARAPSAK